MAMPKTPDARDYYRAAYQRIDDAQSLLDNDRTTAAVYLAGYAVECILKSLLLSCVPNREHGGIMELFRGRLAHDFGWLTMQYVRHSKSTIPREVHRALTRVRTWSTDMRYMTGTTPPDEADSFVDAVKFILHWAKGRL